MSSREPRYLQIISGQTRGPLAPICRAALGAAEVPYAALMRLRNRLYDRGIWRVHDLGRPTISVGNLTAGGTGKTPVVRWLATRLQQAGHRPAVLLRGYRKANAAISDEQQMLETALPGVVVHADANRVSGARHVLASDPSTTHFILDDAFQHRRARRHFDLVLINACEPFGFGHVHPRGLLREAPHGLARANAVLVTHASEIPPQQQHTLNSELRRYCNCPIFQCDHVNDELLSADGLHRLPIGQLNDIRFVLFTGVGHPDAIVAQTRTLRGYRGERLYPDHHDYTRTDLDDLLRRSREAGATALLTTEKDYVKLKPLWHEGMPPLYRLCLHIRFIDDHEQALLQQIRRAISA